MTNLISHATRIFYKAALEWRRQNPDPSLFHNQPFVHIDHRVAELEARIGLKQIARGFKTYSATRTVTSSCLSKDDELELFNYFYVSVSCDPFVWIDSRI